MRQRNAIHQHSIYSISCTRMRQLLRHVRHVTWPIWWNWLTMFHSVVIGWINNRVHALLEIRPVHLVTIIVTYNPKNDLLLYPWGTQGDDVWCSMLIIQLDMISFKLLVESQWVRCSTYFRASVSPKIKCTSSSVTVFERNNKWCNMQKSANYTQVWMTLLSPCLSTFYSSCFHH